MHDTAIRRGIGCRRADGTRPSAPNLLQLRRRHIGTIIGGNGSPKLLAAGFVDGAKTIRVDNFGLMSNFGVDAESVVRLRGVTWSKGQRLGKEDLVLIATGRGGD